MRPESATKRRVSIIQSCYIPWKGFFDLIGRCDEYVIFDEVQFAKRHWHNRNVIKTPSGPLWLTIPVVSKSRFEQPIDEVRIAGSWAEKHWRSLVANYKKAPGFSVWSSLVEGLYEQAEKLERLTEINELFLRSLAAALSLRTVITRDSDYGADGRKTTRLVELCRRAGATIYLSGPSASAYLREEEFAREGVAVEWMEYGPYPAYPQLFGDFVENVSVFDVMFNCGAAASDFIKPCSDAGIHAAI